jgi:predicted Zn-dependent protease
MDTQSKALLALRQYRKAQRLAERAVSAEPDNKSYQYQLAYASVAAEDYDRADSILNKLLASDDAFPERTEAMALQERLRDRQ